MPWSSCCSPCPPGPAAAAQDSLAAARDLYTTADYREALAMLTRLRPAAATPADARAIDQYRAFALFALGQTAEAELVVEGIASIDPTWTLPAGEAPPRLATLFAQARERALPGVLRQRLAAARALYSEKRYDASAEAFTGVLMLLDDPAMAKAAGADLQSMTALATGFRDLSLAADEQARAAVARQPAAPAILAAATPGASDGASAAPARHLTAPASDAASASTRRLRRLRHAATARERVAGRPRPRKRPTSCRRSPSRRRCRARPTSPCRSAARRRSCSTS